MIYRRTGRFRDAYRTLPKEIQEKVIRPFSLFKTNPRHPSLVIKKMKGREDIWEGRIDQDYRFTFHFEKDEKTGETICVFRNVDSHDACLKNP
jgi:mRNA-degrading endonuclease RelE of RelBE toxin-antitoxin system